MVQNDDSLPMIRHDLKNFLSVIMAFTDLLRRRLSKVEDPEIENYLSKIEKKVGETVKYIDNNLNGKQK